MNSDNMTDAIKKHTLPFRIFFFLFMMTSFILNSWAFADELIVKKPLIKDIKIKNAYPLFNRDVEKAMTISVGDPFDESLLAAQEKRIIDRYRIEGYLPEGATISAVKDKRKNAYTIHISIQKGPYIRMDEIEFIGNRKFSKARLAAHMKTFRAGLLPSHGGRFRESFFLKDMEVLTRFYREKGFAEVVIRHELKKDILNKRVDVRIVIEEGPQYSVQSITGNTAFYDSTLKKEIVLFNKGNKYGLGIRKSIENIKTRYRGKGYPDVRVEIKERKEKTPNGENRLLTLVIHEGEQVITDRVIIQGNSYFSEKRIRKEVLTSPASFFRKGVFLEETLAADMMAIKALYLNEGFADVTVIEKREWSKTHKRVSLYLIIDEGIRTIVSSVQTKGNSLLTEEAVLGIIRMKKGSPFTRNMLANDETELAAALAEKGYPHVSVKGEVILSGNKTEADIIYHIETGKPVTMGEVYLSGNFRTRKRVIQKELEMEKGEPFSLKKMVAAQKNIRDLNIFESVRFDTIGIREKEDTVHLMVDVVESPPYYTHAGVGYESDRGLYAHGKIGDQNLFGLNKKTWLSYESSEIGYRGETGYMDHRFLGYRTDMTLTLYTEREQEFNQNFETRTKGATLGFTRKPWKNFTTGINLSFERREQVYDEDLASEDMSSSLFDKRTVIVTTPAVSYDSRDGFMRPRKGMLTISSVDVSRGLSNNLDNFYKWHLDNRFYVTPLSRLTFAFLLRSGFLVPSGSNTEVPDDQLFFLGGTSSVRGFRENRLEYDETGTPIGGRTAVSTSVETRFEISDTFELALFYDAGLLLNTSNHEDQNQIQGAVGTGIRYLTPIGPIGFLYGVKTNPRDDESSGQWHFSIGYTF